MTKIELIDRMAVKLETIDVKKVKGSVDIILDLISETLVKQERAEFRGFGAFSIRINKPITGRNPRTGEPVELGARPIVYFRAGKGLKARLNK